MAVIGYIRVSSNKQTLGHQRFEIERFAAKEGIMIDKWIEEKISSRKELKKRRLGALLDDLKDGDVLIACEISRLGRSLLEVMRILETCLHKNCQVWTLKENYRLGNNIQSKVLAFAFGLAAEIERNLISERTKASLANLKASGKRLGRPPNAQTKRLKLSKNIKRVKSLLAAGMTKTQIAKIFGVQRSTLREFIVRMEKLNDENAKVTVAVAGVTNACHRSMKLKESKNKKSCHQRVKDVHRSCKNSFHSVFAYCQQLTNEKDGSTETLKRRLSRRFD